ncbi:hypothetical protein BO94DRAFT_198147 [Aspergillus sclerotioniger CBS 115572]|uniref:Uncharacterized protein n=1 Tax=Aspergillus sclerotioniger CBS 115572 TaxID=1450535 RepID=A0A317VPS9_9EURO|nr:hypothetical protein BO94DRAFT_198147 [Aspergillus sclerotioniger CBS 115572]PWY76363.1 hypothetical protein BO94DRAFT_198147 [Aspergillus sclerotioniger CBS 115572]
MGSLGLETLAQVRAKSLRTYLVRTVRDLLDHTTKHAMASGPQLSSRSNLGAASLFACSPFAVHPVQFHRSRHCGQGWLMIPERLGSASAPLYLILSFLSPIALLAVSTVSSLSFVPIFSFSFSSFSPPLFYLFLSF